MKDRNVVHAAEGNPQVGAKVVALCGHSFLVGQVVPEFKPETDNACPACVVEVELIIPNPEVKGVRI